MVFLKLLFPHLTPPPHAGVKIGGAVAFKR
jgi:hypothetical protein